MLPSATLPPSFVPMMRPGPPYLPPNAGGGGGGGYGPPPMHMMHGPTPMGPPMSMPPGQMPFYGPPLGPDGMMMLPPPPPLPQNAYYPMQMPPPNAMRPRTGASGGLSAVPPPLQPPPQQPMTAAPPPMQNGVYMPNEPASQPTPQASPAISPPPPPMHPAVKDAGATAEYGKRPAAPTSHPPMMSNGVIEHHQMQQHQQPLMMNGVGVMPSLPMPTMSESMWTTPIASGGGSVSGGGGGDAWSQMHREQVAARTQLHRQYLERAHMTASSEAGQLQDQCLKQMAELAKVEQKVRERCAEDLQKIEMQRKQLSVYRDQQWKAIENKMLRFLESVAPDMVAHASMPPPVPLSDQASSSPPAPFPVEYVKSTSTAVSSGKGASVVSAGGRNGGVDTETIKRYDERQRPREQPPNKLYERIPLLEQFFEKKLGIPPEQIILISLSDLARKAHAKGYACPSLNFNIHSREEAEQLKIDWYLEGQPPPPVAQQQQQTQSADMYAAAQDQDTGDAGYGSEDYGNYPPPAPIESSSSKKGSAPPPPQGHTTEDDEDGYGVESRPSARVASASNGRSAQTPARSSGSAVASHHQRHHSREPPSPTESQTSQTAGAEEEEHARTSHEQQQHEHEQEEPSLLRRRRWSLTRGPVDPPQPMPTAVSTSTTSNGSGSRSSHSKRSSSSRRNG